MHIVKKVRHKEFGIGIVVPDLMNLCHRGCVWVDFDFEGIISCIEADLEVLETVEVRIDAEKCKGCVFSGSKCYRHSNGMLGWPMALGVKNRIPKRIYPHCQDGKQERNTSAKTSTNCPKCGRTKTEEVDDSDSFLGVVGDHMICRSCGHTWQFNSY